MPRLTCFFCREVIVGYVDELQRHVNQHIRNNDFNPSSIFYDCMIPKCKSRYDHFKSLKRHIVLQHPVHSINPADSTEHNVNVDLGSDDEPCVKKPRIQIPASSSDEQAGYTTEKTSTSSLSRIKECLSLGICRLAKDVSLPQSKITEMITVCETLVRMLSEYFQENTQSFLEKNEIDQTSQEAVLFLNCFHLPDLFSDVSTPAKQTQFLNKLAVSIPNPVEKMLQTREDIRHVNGISKRVRINETFTYIPVIETLKLIFRNPQTRKLLDDSQENDQFVKEYHTFRTGETFKKSQFFKDFPNAIRLDLYQDDVELGNPLSSRAGINKISVFNFKIQNMPDKWNSSPRSIFPLLYVTAVDAKKHGYNKILQPMIKDLQKLENGVTVYYGSEKFELRAIVTIFCGDTLALHEIFGLLGPSAKYFCRICTIPRPIFHENPFQTFPLRTKEWYQTNLAKLESGEITRSECGLKQGGCILNELENFHVTENFALDAMHDIAEGLIPLTIQLVLSHYYKTKELGMTIDYINQRIHMFSYGYIDKKNRPSANYTDEMLSRPSTYRLKQTASQNLLLLRAFPFLFGHKVTEDCPYMMMIGHLINITRILMSLIISDHMLASLEEHIRLYEELFYAKFKKRINKNHHLDHYILCIKRSGNMKQFNCLVFEQKNKALKNQATTCRNFKNICKSLAKRQTFRMVTDILDNPFADSITYGPGTIVARESCLSKAFLQPSIAVVFIPKKVTINGIDFRSNLIVCLKNAKDKNYPSYGIIKEIVVIDSRIYFLVKLCITKLYNDFLQAYEVEVNTNEQMLNFEDIHLHTTFAFWTPYGSDKKYISRRNFHRDY